MRYELAAKKNGGVATSTPPVETNYLLTATLQVLLVIALDPGIRMREIAQELHITERAVQRIVDDLNRQGYLAIGRSGRRNTYVINHESVLLKSRQSTVSLGRFLDFLSSPDRTSTINRVDPASTETPLIMD